MTGVVFEEASEARLIGPIIYTRGSDLGKPQGSPRGALGEFFVNFKLGQNVSCGYSKERRD